MRVLHIFLPDAFVDRPSYETVMTWQYEDMRDRFNPALVWAFVRMDQGGFERAAIPREVMQQMAQTEKVPARFATVIVWLFERFVNVC